MITYCIVKSIIDEAFDYEDLFVRLFAVPFTILFDLLFLIFQPVLFIIVKKFEKNEE